MMYILDLNDLINSIYTFTGEEHNDYPIGIYKRTNRYPIELNGKLVYYTTDNGLKGPINLTVPLSDVGDLVTDDYELIVERNEVKYNMVSTMPYLHYKSGLLIKYFLEYYMFKHNIYKELITSDPSGIANDIPLMDVETIFLDCPMDVVRLVYPNIDNSVLDNIYDLLDYELSSIIKIFSENPTVIYDIDTTVDTITITDLGTTEDLRKRMTYDSIICHNREKKD